MGNFNKIQDLKREIKEADAAIREALIKLDPKAALDHLNRRESLERKLEREYAKNDKPHGNVRPIQ